MKRLEALEKMINLGLIDVEEAKQKEQEQLEIGLAIGGIFFVLFLVFVGVNEMMDFCATTRRCGR